MDMENLRKHPKAHCESCPWREKSAYAGETGPEDATIAFVGEAPGAVESRTGVPFSGPSGKLLDKVLQHHRIDRTSALLTNVAGCHPPYSPGQGSVVPPKEVVAACRPRLLHELASRPLTTIVTLGNTAKEAILETRDAITSVRVGPPKRAPKFPDVDIIPTIHPAACLRTSDMFPSLVRDIGKAKDTSLWTKFEQPVFKVFDQPSTAEAALKELSSQGDRRPYITVDIEVGVEKDLNNPDVQLLCVGIGIEPNKAIVIGEQALQSQAVRQALKNLLDNQRLICHNGKFDIAQLYKMDLISSTLPLWADTMLASYAIDERPGNHGLKVLASEMLGAPDYSAVLDKYIDKKTTSYAIIPREILYQYNAWDAALTYNLWERLVPLMEKQDVRKVHDRLIHYSHYLMYVEMEGVKFDLKYNEELYETFEATLEPLELRLAQWVGNPRSPAQVKEALYDLGIRVPDTQAETLQNASERVQGEAKEFLTLLLQHRKEAKSYSTYVKGLRKRVHGERVYSTFLLHGSVTGRTASRNPNLQNITRGVTLRKQFVPDEDNVFVQCDYGQIELRVAAVLAAQYGNLQSTYLTEVFSDSSRDIFDEVGAALYGEAGAKLKENRVRTKAYVYGMNYGREAASIASEYKISLHEAQRGMDAFFGLVPDIVAWRESIETEVKSQALVSPFGRKRRFWLITKENRMDCIKEGLAFKPQSTANDITLSALCKIQQEIGHVRIPVHDSIMVECSQGDKLEVAHEMCRIMQETAKEEFSDLVPFVADYEFGTNWGELSQ